MNRKENMLHLIFWGTIVFSLSLTFYKTFIAGDFAVVEESETDEELTADENEQVESNEFNDSSL